MPLSRISTPLERKLLILALGAFFCALWLQLQTTHTTRTSKEKPATVLAGP